MRALTIYRDRDALSSIPMRIRVNTGGWESVNPAQEATLKTKEPRLTFQVRLLGMKKKVVMDKQASQASHFTVQLGPDSNAAFVILLGLLVAVFVIGMGATATPMNATLIAVGLLLVPLLLTILLGRLTVVPTEPRTLDE